MGYYIAYQDLSRSTVSRETVISNIYYPIFRDARHWASMLVQKADKFLKNAFVFFKTLLVPVRFVGEGAL